MLEMLIKSLASSTLIDTLRDGLVDFVLEQGRDLIKDELKGKLASLRSDAGLRRQIATAVQAAADRWYEQAADKELVRAVNESTHFADLDSVQQAMRQLARHPSAPIAAATLRGKFAEVLPARFEPERIERGVEEYLDILRDELLTVPALQQTQAAYAQLQIERNTAVIADLLEQLLAAPQPTAQTLGVYLKRVIDQHRYLDPRGSMQTVRQVQVLLEEVYVSLAAEAEPELSAADRHLYEWDLRDFMQRHESGAVDQDDLRENLLAKYTGRLAPPDRKPVELAELVRSHAKLVILGDPGAGKTTLMRYLALIHAQALRRGECEIQAYGPTRLPLYLRIADYAEQGNGQSLDDFLPRALCGDDHHDPALETLVRASLQAGGCLVLLDGLDEVIEPSQRAGIADRINLFVRTHESAGNRFVVTSRVAGYRSAPLGGEVAHYRVCDMNDEQITRFLRQWCYAVERFQTPDLSPEAQASKAEAEITGITRAIADSPGVRRLAANPLLLRTLALIHRTGARLPQRRIELYRLTAETLIRDWELARGIPQAALVSEAEATRLLGELAAWMHQTKPAGIATEGEVKRKLAEVKAGLAGKEADNPEILQAVDDFLSKIRQHTGLFVVRAPQRYGFMHLTFEEYFAARWLVARPRQAARRIRERLHLPRWEEPILLAVGFYGMEFPDDVDHLFEEALLGENLGGPSPYEPLLHRDLLFAVRALGDQDTGPALRRRLVREFTGVLFDPQGARQFDLLKKRCANVFSALPGSAAYTETALHLLAALQDPDKDVRASAAHALGNATDSPDVVAALLTALRDSADDVRAGAALALVKATDNPDAVAALCAALQDKAENVRTRVVWALRNATDNPGVVAALLTALRDSADDVRTRAVWALGNAIDSPGVAEALLGVLHGDPAENVRAAAAAALGYATDRPPDDVAALLAALHDPWSYVRAQAASALVSVTASPGVVDALLTALHDPEENVRAGAAWALRSATDNPDDVTALLAALHDPAENVRAGAAWALRNTTASPGVADALFAALHDPAENVRAGAAWALRNATTNPGVAAALLTALHDSAENVRVSAALALPSAIDSPGAVTALLTALHGDTTNSVRAGAALTLGKATNNPGVVTALLTALRDPAEDVRADAALSLYALASQAEPPPDPDFADRLAASLSLPDLDTYSIHANSYPINSLFNALAAVAPTPGQQGLKEQPA